jgi:hypothetical protein
VEVCVSFLSLTLLLLPVSTRGGADFTLFLSDEDFDKYIGNFAKQVYELAKAGGQL